MTDAENDGNAETFSREFARRLNGVISEAPKPPTGQQIARAIGRNDGYVSERRRGLRSWTVEDVDLIAELLGTTGLELIGEVLSRMDTPADARSTNVVPLAAPRLADPATAYTLEDADDHRLPLNVRIQILMDNGFTYSDARARARRPRRTYPDVATTAARQDYRTELKEFRGETPGDAD